MGGHILLHRFTHKGMELHRWSYAHMSSFSVEHRQFSNMFGNVPRFFLNAVLRTCPAS